jgi:hypothetical protein
MSFRVKTWIAGCLSLMIVTILAGTAYTEVPQKINYQGRLTDNVTGDPRVGSHSMTFRLYDEAAEGSELWSESHVVVADSAGVIAVILGGTAPIDIAFDGPTWLEVEVMGEVLSPRRELVSVPYAFRSSEADSLDGHSAGEFVLKGEISSITVDMIVGGTGSGLDADLVDGLSADAFADSGHTHDEMYYTQDSLSTPGAVNDAANPVDWTKLKGVPVGFADGTDDVGEAADGYSLDADDGDPVDAVYVDAEGDVGVGTTSPGEKLEVAGTVRMEGFSLPLGADSGYVLTSDAAGMGTWQAGPVYSDTAHQHDDRYYTESELNTSDGDDPNTGSNRVSWDNLTDVPADFADGSDEVGGSGDGHSLDAVDGDPTDVVYVDEYGYVGIGMDPEVALDIHSPFSSYCYLRLTHEGTGTGFYDGTRFFVGPGGHARIMNYETAGLDFGTDNETRLTITSDGDVGIGMYDPLNLLHIHRASAGGSNVRFTNNQTGTTYDDGFLVGIDEDGDAKLLSMEDRHLSIGTNGTETIRILATGRVGIGTYNPNKLLHLHEPTAGSSCYLQVTDQAIGSGVNDGLLVGVDHIGWAYVVNQENAPLYLGANDYIRATILPDGDVGIGTTAPASRLHVHSIGPSSCYAQWTNGTTGDGSTDGLKIGLHIDGRTYIANRENTSLAILTNGTERMQIAANGNVGIGDNDPKVKLAVTGVARIQNLAAWPTQGEGMELAYNADLNRGYIQVYDRDAGTWGSLSLGSGNVGIGTSDPAVKFEVKGDDPFVGLNTTNNKTGLRFQKNGTTEWEMAWNQGSGYLYLYNSGTRFVIEDATGDVGIGTVTPTSRLDVGGTAGHNQLRLRQSYTPTGTSDPNGQTGDVAWDNNCVYVKTSGGWKRATLSTF